MKQDKDTVRQYPLEQHPKVVIDRTQGRGCQTEAREGTT